MALLRKLGQLLPYFFVSRLITKIAPRTAYLVFGDNKISVDVVTMSNNEWIVRRRRIKTMTDTLYIKMILSLDKSVFEWWQWKDGDKFILREERKHRIHCVGDSVLYNNKPYDLEVTSGDIADNLFDAVPLPSQKQLQYMMEFDPIDFIEGLYRYSQEPLNPNADPEQFDADMECYMLAFVMEKKYNKIWNGENWVELKRLNYD